MSDKNKSGRPTQVQGPNTAGFQPPALEGVPEQPLALRADEDSLTPVWSQILGDDIPLTDGLTGEEYDRDLVKALFGLDEDAAKWASYTAHGFIEPLNGNVLLGYLSDIKELPSTFTPGKMRKVGMVEGLAYRYSKPDARNFTKMKKDPPFNPADYRLEGGVYSLGEITALQKMGAAIGRIICVRFGLYVGDSITKKNAIFQVASAEQTQTVLPRMVKANLVGEAALSSKPLPPKQFR